MTRSLLDLAADAAADDQTFGELRRAYELDPERTRLGYRLAPAEEQLLASVHPDFERVQRMWWQRRELAQAEFELSEAEEALLEALPPPRGVVVAQLDARDERARPSRPPAPRPTRAADLVPHGVADLTEATDRAEAEREIVARNLLPKRLQARMAAAPKSAHYRGRTRDRIRRKEAMQPRPHGGMLEYGASARDVELWMRKGLSSADTTERWWCQKLRGANAPWAQLCIAYTLWHVAARVTAPRSPYVGSVDGYSRLQLAALLPCRNAKGRMFHEDTVTRHLRALKKILSPSLELWQPDGEAVANKGMPGARHYLSSPDEITHWAYNVYRVRPVAADGTPVVKSEAASRAPFALSPADPRSGYFEPNKDKDFAPSRRHRQGAEPAATGPPASSGAVPAPHRAAPRPIPGARGGS